ncbi:MAG: GNAT family protein [Pseudomonadota bacterium]
MLRGLFRAGSPRAVLTAPPQAMAAAVKPPPTDLVLHQEGVILRAGQPQDFVAWARARTASRADITVWEPDWRDKDMTRTAFLRRLSADARQWRAGRRYSFFTLEEGTERLLGGISLSDVRRGNRQAGMLGYWVANGETGRGVGTRAVAGVAHFAFNRLHLNRLEAACQPGNLGSRRILEKNGFACEGIMRRYLRINGHWCDHEIWARVQG